MNKIGIVNDDDDSKSLISFINSVENCYCQLSEVKQLTSITMSHIDDLCDKLPLLIRKDWMRLYRSLDGIDRGVYSGKSDCLVLLKNWSFFRKTGKKRHVFGLKSAQKPMKEQS